MDWQARFYEFMAEWLRSQSPSYDVAKVTSVEQDSYSSGGCETCATIINEIIVYWEDSHGEAKNETFLCRLDDLFS